ncbi:unnamed protein product [Durusdinium trenchii]|uniref:Uncharacterized protein n=1 Tax=Durusdinium trenchii TaxID=1381693 RepID=A0ABP0KU78_9DINO
MELDLNEDLVELEPLHFEECDFSFCGDLEAGRFDLEGPPNSESAAGQVLLDDDACHNGSGAQSEAGKIEEAGFDPDLETNSASVSMNDWNLTVNHSFERYRALDPSLKLPWEMPGMQGLFTDGSNLSLPQVHGVAFEHVLQSNSREGNTVVTGEIVGCEDAAYLKAVSDLQDLDYFENKRQQTELALSRWMDILSIDWETSGVGLQLLEDWRVDPSGDGAMATLRERLPCTQDRVAEAIEQANAEEDLLSVKQEVDDLSNVAASASDLTLFPASLVPLGLIEIENSSGSESSTSSTEGSDDEPLNKEPVFVEHALDAAIERARKTRQEG